MKSSVLDPYYGWAMNFGKGYQAQSNIPSISAQTSRSIPDTKCDFFYTDGRYSGLAPYYQLGPQPYHNCPFYNYTLPDTYPKVPSPTINPRAYWYLPYSTFDWSQYEQASLPVIPKPSN